MFMDIRRIELGLVNHSCTEALAWCNENKAALRKLKVHYLQQLLLEDLAHIFWRARWNLTSGSRSILNSLAFVKRMKPLGT